MIDMNKKYTYNGKPVRIYADGGDTYVNAIHGAIKDSDGWVSCSFNESDLVEVWQPKESELVWAWDIGDTLPYVIRYCTISASLDYENYAPFTGTLPEAFKGLI